MKFSDVRAGDLIRSREGKWFRVEYVDEVPDVKPAQVAIYCRRGPCFTHWAEAHMPEDAVLRDE